MDRIIHSIVMNNINIFSFLLQSQECFTLIEFSDKSNQMQIDSMIISKKANLIFLHQIYDQNNGFNASNEYFYDSNSFSTT